jgi:hypothetical protein
MGGGLLNIISYGNQNIMLNGNPSKTFFKTVYAKYTNFGLQKFRIDYEGQRGLKLNEDTHLTFKLPRHGELLMDSFLVFQLPDIWSPILPPNTLQDSWKPYEFRWISHIGANIIKKAKINIGGTTIQEFSGEYLKNRADRDFSATQKELFEKMIGHEHVLYKPEIAHNRLRRYPHSFYNVNPIEPSIRGRTIYVPLHFWFMNSSKMALPMVSLQYHEVYITLELRSIRELFTISDVSKGYDTFTTDPIQPNFNIELHSLYRFLQPPKAVSLDKVNYNTALTSWDSDIHLMTTYAFLTDEESRTFAANEQRYLIKDIYETNQRNITGNRRVRIDTTAMVSSWMFYFKRNDVYKRNQWTNYTNWDYQDVLPSDVIEAPRTSDYAVERISIGPGANYKTEGGSTILSATPYFISPIATIKNIKQILLNLSILLDGKYREFPFGPGIYTYLEKYRTGSSSKDDVYCYNFCLDPDHSELQPSGAINLSRFKTVELDVSTILPDPNPAASFQVICDTEGTVIGTSQVDQLYIYQYDFYITEERYNLLRIIGGHAGLLYTR